MRFFADWKVLHCELKHIVSLKAEFDRKIGVTLSNGERLVIPDSTRKALRKNWGSSVKNKLDSLFFTRLFVPERHK